MSPPEGGGPTLNHEHDRYRRCALPDAIALAHWPEVKAGFRLAAATLSGTAGQENGHR